MSAAEFAAADLEHARLWLAASRDERALAELDAIYDEASRRK